MTGMAYSRFYGRPSRLFNVLGMHKYMRRPLVERADEWAWRMYDYFDRSWVSERKAAV